MKYSVSSLTYFTLDMVSYLLLVVAALALSDRTVSRKKEDKTDLVIMHDWRHIPLYHSPLI